MSVYRAASRLHRIANARAAGPGLTTLHYIIPECSEGTPGLNRKSMLMLMMAMVLYFALYFGQLV